MKTDERKGLPSASSMDADIRCYGRRALIKKLGLNKKESKSAQRGSKIHEALEGEGDIEALSNSDQYTVNMLMNEEAKILDQLSNQQYDFIHCEVIKEKRLWMFDSHMDLSYSAQLDSLRIDRDIGVIIDFKSGYGINVPIQENWQIRTQAACAYSNYNLKKIHGALIHPHHPKLKSEVIEFSEKDLKKITEELECHLSKMTEDAPRTPNKISCLYCPAKQDCPERKAQIEAISASMEKEKNISNMSPKERGERVYFLKCLQQLVKDELDGYKKLLFEDDQSVEGYKLKQSMMRIITNGAKAHELVEKELTKDIADACINFSIAELENYLKAKGMKKKEATGYAETLLCSVLEKKTKEASLVEI